jgi:LacI family transcriptional regulator
METYHCSWATVQRAMNELCLEGLIRSERGRGTFVAEGALLGTMPNWPGKPEPGSISNTGSVQLLPATPAAGLSTTDLKATTTSSVQILLMHRVQSVYYSLAQMMDGIRQASHKIGRPVSYLDAPPELHWQLNLDGFVIVTPSFNDRPLLEAAWQRGERFIVLGSDYDESELPCVNADTRGGCRSAVRKLVEAGHKNIGMLGLFPGFPNYQREKQGYEDALAEAGIRLDPSWVLARAPLAENLEQDIEQWLDQHDNATAIFFADYTTALAFMRVAKERNVRIPQDFSVIGVDELPSPGMLQTPITAISQPFSQMGQRAVERLVHLLEYDEVGGAELLPCRIISRDSIAALK